MGLDVSAWEKVELVKNRADMTDADWDYESGYTVLTDNYEGFTQNDGLGSGLYQASGYSVEFSAGSYGGYNRWREQLACLVGTTSDAIWDNPKPGPFVELINFSDCEGTIGPKTSVKLASDFAEWKDRARERTSPEFISKYLDFERVFNTAAKGGAVRFH